MRPKLCCFAGLLEKHSKNPDELQVFEKSVWKYDLLSYCVIALRYDFTSVSTSTS